MKRGQTELLKMSKLAERSGVPAATIKHYLREGLLPEPVARTGRTMSYYGPETVERLRVIKRLQSVRFLPLKVIREVLDDVDDTTDEIEITRSVTNVLKRIQSEDSITRSALLEAGVLSADLDRMAAIGLIAPVRQGREQVYRGDDLAVLRTLGAARRAGITAEMASIETLDPYIQAIRALVRVELELFRRFIVPAAGDRLAPITEAATALSEQFVVLARRKLLVPMLEQLHGELGAKRAPARRRAQRKRSARRATATRPSTRPKRHARSEVTS